MPVYSCPDCGSKLRPANPVPAGKKIRCPECGLVFAPAGAAGGGTPAAKAPAKAPPKAAPKPAAPFDEDEDAKIGYGVVQSDETKTEDNTRSAFDPIKDRFKRSARGPALVHVVKPSTALLATGIALCLAAITGALWAIWPMVFKLEVVQPEEKGAKFRPPTQNTRRFQELKPEEQTERFIFLGVFVGQFLWGAGIAGGASRLHMLETYKLAMGGAAMAILNPFLAYFGYYFFEAYEKEDILRIGTLGLSVLAGVAALMCGLWCVRILRLPAVMAGFAEEKMDDI